MIPSQNQLIDGVSSYNWASCGNFCPGNRHPFRGQNSGRKNAVTRNRTRPGSRASLKEKCICRCYCFWLFGAFEAWRQNSNGAFWPLKNCPRNLSNRLPFCWEKWKDPFLAHINICLPTKIVKCLKGWTNYCRSDIEKPQSYLFTSPPSSTTLFEVVGVLLIVMGAMKDLTMSGSSDDWSFTWAFDSNGKGLLALTIGCSVTFCTLCLCCIPVCWAECARPEIRHAFAQECGKFKRCCGHTFCCVASVVAIAATFAVRGVATGDGGR